MNILKKLFNKIFSCYRLYILDNTFSLNIKLIKSKNNLVFQKLDNNFKNIQSLDSYRKEYSKIIQDRLNNTDFVGFICYEKDTLKLVAIQWIQVNNVFIEEISELFLLNKNEAYFIDDYTIPTYRKKGIHSNLMNFRINYCIENNISKIYILIICGNTPAVKAIKKIHFKIFRKYFSIRKFKLL